MQDPATSRALALQEVVSSIVGAMYQNYSDNEDDRTIFACLTVASHWEIEASRRLWDRCVQVIAPRPWPAVLDLLAIVPERQQRYANHVSFLEISADDAEASKGEYQSLGQLISRLSHLQWPRLEDLQLLDFGGSGISSRATLSFQTFCQPRLRFMSIISSRDLTSFKLSNDFLNNLSRCTDLESLFLPVDRLQHTLSPAGICSFLSHMRQLHSFTVGPGLKEAVSSDVFAALSNIPSLLSLAIPDVMDSWICELGQGLKGRRAGLFGDLNSLNCGISSRGLEDLLPLIPQMDRLAVKAHEGSTGAFDAVVSAHLAELTEFSLQHCSRTTIQASSVLKFVQHAHGLTSLQIPQKWGGEVGNVDLPAFEGMVDELFESIVVCTPALTTLQLGFNQKGLTEDALLSLARHCPKLSRCKLSAIVDFDKLVRAPLMSYWPALRTLGIVYPDEGEEGEEEQYLASLNRDIHSIVEKLLVCMPQLWSMDLMNDRELNNASNEKLRPRLWS